MLKLIDKLLKFDFNNKGAERSSTTHDMDPKLIRHLFTLIVMILILDLSIGVQAKTSGKTSKTSDNKKVIQEKKENERFISIDFNNVDINVFINLLVN